MDNKEVTENNVNSTVYELALYDDYYTDVLNYLDNIDTKEETIIQNQELSIEHLENILSGVSLFSFLLALFLVYTLIRNMIVSN